jgi:hypothetical protein
MRHRDADRTGSTVLHKESPMFTALHPDIFVSRRIFSDADIASIRRGIVAADNHDDPQEGGHSVDDVHFTDYTDRLRRSGGDKKKKKESEDDPQKPPKVDKPHDLKRIADKLGPYVSRLSLACGVPGIVDPMCKGYAIPPGYGVPLHRDDDFSGVYGIARYSVLLFLNDDYEGGATVFPEHGTFVAEKGDVLVFRHDILHGADPVRTGVKRVIKTDIFVR